MATNDGFDPGDSLPLFLGKPEQEIGTNRAVILLRGLMVAAAIAICILFAGKPEQEIGTNRAVISLRGLMVAAATAICIGILSNQVTLFADVTASQVAASTWHRSIDASNSISRNSINH